MNNAINKKNLHFDKMETFLSKKIAYNASNTSYTEGLDGKLMIGEPDVLWQSVCFIKDELKIWTHGLLYSGSEPLSELNTYTKSEIDALLEEAGKVKSVNGETGDVIINSDSLNLTPVATSGSYNDLSDTPESLPANGGNADTVNGYKFVVDSSEGSDNNTIYFVI